MAAVATVGRRVRTGEAGWGQGLTLSRQDAKKDDQFERDLEGRPLE